MHEATLQELYSHIKPEAKIRLNEYTSFGTSFYRIGYRNGLWSGWREVEELLCGYYASPYSFPTKEQAIEFVHSMWFEVNAPMS